ncbi:hypothetical protein L6R53_15980 [Myxococcota bacterium]|nr:hypothetical protein [Myxococcota bacterium]
MLRRALPSALILLAALLVRLWLPDWDRYLPPVGGRWPPGGVFDGHERGYVLAFLGQRPDPSTQAWPLLAWGYQALGHLSADPRLLVGVNTLAGASVPLAASLWVARRFGRAAGLWTGVLAALLPEAVAWSGSAYNVAIPTALLAWAFVARRPLVVALLVSLAVSMRGELALLAPFAGPVGLVGMPVAAAWLSALGGPDPGDPLLALRTNLPLLGLLGPPVLLLGLLALRDRRAWPVAAFVLWNLLSSATFADLGGRHLVLGGVGACALVGVAAARLRHLPGVVAALGLLWGLEDLSERWYRQAPLPAEELAGLPAPDPACVEVTEEPPIPGQPLPSHLGLWTGQVQGPCVLWGETAIHRAWTSRGLQDRALRMRALYELEPVAARRREGGDVLLWRVRRPG